MPRPILAPLAVALSVLLAVSPIQADPTSPLFVVEQQRSALVSRLARQWSDAFAVLPRERRLDHEQLSNALFALRADRLFAVTLAGDADAVEAVLAEAKREAAKPRAATKALGDATADLAYTPISPCRILDTRATAAGPLAANVARTFDGYSTNFASQGGTGSGCGIPAGVAALAMNVYAVNPTNLGFIKVWPANGTEPDVSTVNYQPGITAIATGTLVPVDQANSNRFTAKSPATVDFIADVVGYFKLPGDATGLDIKVAGQRVMRYDSFYNVIGGYYQNKVIGSASGAPIAGGGGNWGYENLASTFAAVGGGAANAARGAYSTVAGGGGNGAHGDGSTVAGGSGNLASGDNAAVSGGWGNRASGAHSTIGGGSANAASGDHSAVVGGGSNAATGSQSTVLNGAYNLASGAGSLAAGWAARTQTADPVPVVHDGAFVWADRLLGVTGFHSIASNEFAARATGGVRFVTAIDGTGLPTWTCGVSGGAGGSWGCTSDRDAKTDLTPLDGVATLDRLAALPVYQWAAKDDPRRTPHAGPTAQDFMAAFGLGDNDRMIGFADAQGVAFAAIQGLDAKLQERESAQRADTKAAQDEIDALRREVAELGRALHALATRLSPDAIAEVAR
jgi:hypothetical protein